MYLICTPDKDLSQYVVGRRVVQLDRRRDVLSDGAGVVAKFGVKPVSIPDYTLLPAFIRLPTAHGTAQLHKAPVRGWFLRGKVDRLLGTRIEKLVQKSALACAHVARHRHKT